MRVRLRSWVAPGLAGQRGAGLLETALVMMILLSLLAGVADAGRAFHSYIVITNAAREGARAAARLPCRAENRGVLRAAIVAAATGEAQDSGVTVSAGNVSVSPDPVSQGCAAPGAPIAVTVTHSQPSLVGTFVGMGAIPLEARVSMASYGTD
jgi:Flp pilus assembly protein TadG